MVYPLTGAQQNTSAVNQNIQVAKGISSLLHHAGHLVFLCQIHRHRPRPATVIDDGSSRALSSIQIDVSHDYSASGLSAFQRGSMPQAFSTTGHHHYFIFEWHIAFLLSPILSQCGSIPM